jgi:hypothetical protein
VQNAQSQSAYILVPAIGVVAVQVKKLEKQVATQRVLIKSLQHEVSTAELARAEIQGKLQQRIKSLDAELTRVRLVSYKLKSEHLEQSAKFAAWEHQLGKMCDTTNTEWLAGESAGGPACGPLAI